KTYIAPTVLARIAGADGWLARAAGSQQMVKDDVQAIRAYLAAHGRDPSSLRYGHLNFTHLVDTDDRAKALMLQRPYIERVMGTHRSFENLQESYFLGTTREIVERIDDLERAGIQDMVLATCGDDLEQLERFSSEIVGRFPREARRSSGARRPMPASGLRYRCYHDTLALQWQRSSSVPSMTRWPSACGFRLASAACLWSRRPGAFSPRARNRAAPRSRPGPRRSAHASVRTGPVVSI